MRVMPIEKARSLRRTFAKAGPDRQAIFMHERHDLVKYFWSACFQLAIQTNGSRSVHQNFRLHARAICQMLFLKVRYESGKTLGPLGRPKFRTVSICSDYQHAFAVGSVLARSRTVGASKLAQSGFHWLSSLWDWEHGWGKGQRCATHRTRRQKTLSEDSCGLVADILPSGNLLTALA